MPSLLRNRVRRRWHCGYQLDEAKLLEQASFFNSKRTRLTIFSIALDHQTHHRAQTAIYLRLKGVTPPPEP